MSGWIKAVTMIESVHLALFEHVLEGCVSSVEAIYWSDDQLGMILDTENDEFWFRMALLHDTSIGDIHRVDDLSYVMNPRFMEEVRAVMDRGIFRGRVFPLTVVYLELAHAISLSALSEGLVASRSMFGGHAPDLVVV
jgi:hypothetical protein